MKLPCRKFLQLVGSAASSRNTGNGNGLERGIRSSAFAGTIGAMAISLCFGVPTAASAQDDVAGFYKGKTVRLVVGGVAGGGPDLVSRLFARHLQQHIPGNPSIIVQNMPGAGSMLMTNNLYSSGTRDGTMIGAPLNSVPTAPLLQPNAARFDPVKMNWIGSIYRSTHVALAWHTAPVQSLEGLRTRELLFGATSPGTGGYDIGSASRDILGMKLKIVRGYQGAPQILIAMERGEIHAYINDWDSTKASKGSWIRDKLLTVIGHYSLEDPPELRPYARIVDLAATDADRQALRLVLVRQSYGRPYFLPPDVPMERVVALRRAFDATMRDSAFHGEAQKMQISVDSMTGEETQALIVQVHQTTPPHVAERVRRSLEPAAN